VKRVEVDQKTAFIRNPNLSFKKKKQNEDQKHRPSVNPPRNNKQKNRKELLAIQRHPNKKKRVKKVLKARLHSKERGS